MVAAVSLVAELEVAVVSLVAEPEVAFVVAAVLVADLSVADVALVFAADIAEHQVSVDIVLAYAVLVPASVVEVEVDSAEHPRFPFPTLDYYASFSSSVEVVGWESVHNTTSVHTKYVSGSILSNLVLHRNKSLVHCYNMPNPGYNSANDTSDLPMDATTSHSRKTSLHLYREQHTHRPYQALLSHPEVPQM